MTELTTLSIADAREKLRAKEISAAELTEAYIATVEGGDALNAYCVKTPEIAREQAKAADGRLASGDAPSLCGIPIGVKDLYCTKGVNSQSGSNILKDFKPAYESTVTQNLWDEGAVMLGKLSMDEFAMGSSNETACYGNVVSPWRAQGSEDNLTPGGSSGGSASALAADMAMATLGTDTGGSIRQPAAFTGVVGLKPTWGRVSRWGIIAFASSLDQAGPFTRTVRDAAIMLGAMASVDDKDSTSAEIEIPDYEAALTGDIKGKRIGVPKEYVADGMSSEIKALWEKGADDLRAKGAEIVEISLPHTKYALPAYYIIAPAEASSNLARYDGVRYGQRAEIGQGDGITEMYEKSRAAGFGAEVKRRIMIGSYVLSAGYYDAYYSRAQKIRTLIKQDFETAFETVDAILTPTTPSPAFKLGEEMSPVEMYMQDIFTVTVNMAGLPGISVPAGMSDDGLPLGLQLIGKAFDEANLLNTAYALEDTAGFTAKPEKWW
jgi:aspartyl-tRNA(Asn)/glutamyl-tRNA(Gln) amidotransferase subunit A